jgi:hypothetical protein
MLTMSVIHKTTLSPGKLELLTPWLPAQTWYEGRRPTLVKAGGFRLDDPAGVVGLEFMLVADTSGDDPVVYHVPLTYRGAPLDGADSALVGTAEHGVLGRRWVYDATRDPVLTAALLALLRGSAVPQAQSISETSDQSVHAHLDGADITAAAPVFSGPELAAGPGSSVRIARVLRPAGDDSCAAAGARGCVTAPWRIPGGAEQRGPLFTVQG